MRHLLALLLALSSVPAAPQQVGTLVSADPLAETPPGVPAWRVRSWTSTQDSERQEVTGMVVAPREAMPGRAPHVIAWTHGPCGVAERSAPSHETGEASRRERGGRAGENRRGGE